MAKHTTIGHEARSFEITRTDAVQVPDREYKHTQPTSKQCHQVCFLLWSLGIPRSSKIALLYAGPLPHTFRFPYDTKWVLATLGTFVFFTCFLGVRYLGSPLNQKMTQSLTLHCPSFFFWIENTQTSLIIKSSRYIMEKSQYKKRGTLFNPNRKIKDA